MNCLIFSASFRTLIFLMFPGRLFQKPEKEFCRIFSKNFWINRLKWFIHTLTVQKTGLDTVFLLLMGLHWRFPCPMIPLRNLGLLPAATIMMFSGLKVCSQLFMMSFSTRSLMVRYIRKRPANVIRQENTGPGCRNWTLPTMPCSFLTVDITQKNYMRIWFPMDATFWCV